MWRVAQYICLNPIRSGLVDDPCEYPWSSAEALLRGKSNGVALEDWINERNREAFRETVLDEVEASNINYAVRRNLPYTSTAGIQKLEGSCSSRLIPNPKGKTKSGTLKIRDGGVFKPINIPRP
jgi:hypothetical protein